MVTDDEMLQADAAFTCGGFGSETVWISHDRANQRAVSAIVERRGRQQIGDHTVTEVVEVELPRSWPDGVPTVVEGLDQIELELRPGETRRTVHVNRVLAVDASTYLLECYA